MGDLEQAKNYHQQALKIQKPQSLDPKYVDIVTNSCNNLAEVHFEMGEFEQAKEYYQEALEIRKNIIRHTDKRIQRLNDLLRELIFN